MNFKTFIAIKTDKMHELSLSAYGILATMLNIPEADYKTFDELKNHYFPNDSETELKNGIDELKKQGYILEIENEIFTVNKSMLPNMKVISLKNKGGLSNNGCF